MLFLIFAAYSVQGLRISNPSNSLPESDFTKSTAVSNEVLEAFSLVTNAHNNPDQKIDLKKTIKAMHAVAKHFDAKPFIMVTQQRSGSMWVRSLLNSHPEIACLREYFHKHEGTLRDAFEDSLDAVEKEHYERGTGPKPNLKFIGFKLMIDQFENVEDLWDATSLESKPIFVMHFRRNVLRRFISSKANQHYSWGPFKHPRNAEQASAVASYKPTIDVKHLVTKIEEDFAQRRAAIDMVKKSGMPTCPHSKYEEWVEHPWMSTKSFLDCLGLPMQKLTSPYSSIHGHKQIVESVENFWEVRAALKDTQYAYMLEDGATHEQNYENLKTSDKFSELPQ